MCLANLRRGDRNGVTQVIVVVAPAREMLVEEFAERRSGPGHGVHAIRDGRDRIAREHSARYLTMLHGHAVHVTREAQCQEGHIEHPTVATVRLVQQLGLVFAEHLHYLLPTELVVAGGNWRVGGEYAALTDQFNIHVLQVAAETVA